MTNDTVKRMANYEHLTFLDISYATDVTDEGLNAFHGKTLPISQLYINGLTQVSNEGVTNIIASCFETLKILEAALLSQE